MKSGVGVDGGKVGVGVFAGGRPVSGVNSRPWLLGRLTVLVKARSGKTKQSLPEERDLARAPDNEGNI